MKNPQVKRIIGIAAIALLTACAPKKESATEEDKKMEMTATEEPATEVAVFDGVDPAVKTQVNGLLTNYFQMTKSLVDDNADGARAAAKIFRDNLSKFDMSKLNGDQMSFYHVQERNLSAALKRIQESVDLDEMRMEVANASDSMYAMIKAYGANSAEVYYNFCPMARNNKGAFWLSEVKEIENPYMGQMMPHCGSTKEVLK